MQRARDTNLLDGLVVFQDFPELHRAVDTDHIELQFYTSIANNTQPFQRDVLLECLGQDNGSLRLDFVFSQIYSGAKIIYTAS